LRGRKQKAVRGKRTNHGKEKRGKIDLVFLHKTLGKNLQGGVKTVRKKPHVLHVLEPGDVRGVGRERGEGNVLPGA